MTDQTSTIPKGWKITTLGEVLVLKNGKSRPKDGGKYPVYGGNGVLGYADEYNVDEKIIIVGRVGAYCGSIFFEKEKFWLSDNALGVLPKENLNIDFLYYLLKKTNLNKQAIGGAQPLLTQGVINQIEVLAPEDKEEQRAIAAVLSSLDDKIELLREQNKTLEATAQAIFKEWFVNFNFPNATSKMIDSELGKIPERWRVGKLTDFFDFMEGPGIRSWQYTESGRRFINIRLIQNGDIDIKNSNFVSIEEAEGVYKHFHLQEKDMIVSTSGTLGRSAIVRKEHLPLMLNTSVIRFRPIDKLSYGFMYQFLNSPFFQNELESLASGSVQLNFGPIHLKQIEMIIPNEKILKAYAMSANPLYEKIASNFSQTQTLTAIRDTLLPKLMKGDVRVKGFNN